MHVVRNAFDHAIETRRRARRGAASPPRARSASRRFQRGNHVVIEVADDGRGIDADGDARSAAERGPRRSRDDVLTRARGRSTWSSRPGSRRAARSRRRAAAASAWTSCATNMTALGGVVDVESTAGPRHDDHDHAADHARDHPGADRRRRATSASRFRSTSVLETLLSMRSDDPAQRGPRAAQPARRAAAAAPARRRVRARPRPRRRAKPFVVVIGLGEARLGLLVDRLDGQQDIVIKPIQGPIRSRARHRRRDRARRSGARARARRRRRWSRRLGRRREAA